MKKILLLAFLLPLLAMADEPYTAYAELLGSQKGLFSRKVKINIDFGQEVSFWKAGNMRLVDTNGKDIVFNSMVDAMNFMGKCGWEFVQAFVVTEGQQNVYHWLLSKKVTCEDDIKAGFNVKADFAGKGEVVTISYYRKNKKSIEWDEIKVETLEDPTTDEVMELSNSWKNQLSEIYDYDCKITKSKR